MVKWELKKQNKKLCALVSKYSFRLFLEFHFSGQAFIVMIICNGDLQARPKQSIHDTRAFCQVVLPGGRRRSAARRYVVVTLGV